MFQYILKRLFAGLLTVIALVTSSFFSGPFPPAEEREVPPEVRKAIEQKYGLDKPVGSHGNDLRHGDLGISYKKPDKTEGA